MTWTYALDFTATRDQIRLLIGDTDGADEQLQDEEIAYIVSQESGTIRAAVVACEMLAAKYARKVDYAVGKDVQQRLSQRAQAYITLAQQLRQKVALEGLAPVAPALTQSGKEAAEDNSDLVSPFFRRDQDTEPGTEPVPVLPREQQSGPF